MAGADDKLVNDYLRKHVADPWKRGNVLPIARNMQTGELAPAVPEGVRSLANAVPEGVRSLVNSVLGFITTDPRDPASGRISDEAVAGSTDFVSMLAGGGVTAGLRHGVKAALDPTVASVFVKPAPAAIDAAEAAVSKGATRRQLWDDLGVFKGRDGNWRREIDDSQARPTANWLFEDFGHFGNDGRFENMLDHPELLQAVPELRGSWTRIFEGPEGGSFDPSSAAHGGKWQIRAQGETPDVALNVLLHEAQHGAQKAFGLKTGWNAARPLKDALEVDNIINSALDARLATRAETQRFINGLSDNDDFMTALVKNRPGLAQQVGADKLLDASVMLGSTKPHPKLVRYFFDAGETEARNVQTRHRLATQNGVDLRTLPPWHTQDVPDTWQFLR